MVMESLEDSNCHSMSHSFSLYERYMRSFKVVDNFTTEKQKETSNLTNGCDFEYYSSPGNIEIGINAGTEIKHCLVNPDSHCLLDNIAAVVDKDSVGIYSFAKPESSSESASHILLGSSSATTCNNNSTLTDKSDAADTPTSTTSEDSKPCFKQPVFITSNMENSNNAVDSVPLFSGIRQSETFFKLPTSELSFNGTLKHIQRLKPIVDPITALAGNTHLVMDLQHNPLTDLTENLQNILSNNNHNTEEISQHERNKSPGCKDSKKIEDLSVNEQDSSRWNLDQSYSSLDASYDSGVRSPDMFSDEDREDIEPVSKPFWSFLKEYEAFDKNKVKRMEQTLNGVLPPPSLTILKTDVSEMLKKYYSFLSAFNSDTKLKKSEIISTPEQKVSFIETETDNRNKTPSEDILNIFSCTANTNDNKNGVNSNNDDKYAEIKIGSEAEVKETAWPDILKCKYYDVYYNVTRHSERIEWLALKLNERYVGAETDTSVNIYSGGNQSPSSASKRKALRLKMAQAKSPGRRLSHLARRRQAFCSAATINEKAHTSTSKMVLIDKNFFPHRKLINSTDRKSPRIRRTPGKKTPTRRTPGKKTPSKTPKMRSGGSSHKKAMRRLLIDSEIITRSQPTRETLKRALFISPENRKSMPSVPSASVPAHAMKSKRALFGSPDRADTKSLDGTKSDNFLKRKRDALDDDPESSRTKIAKSLSYGGDTLSLSQPHSFGRRASEIFSAKNSAELNENHKKKLLWAVSEALRVHGWRMSSPGFREKASNLARLTRRLLKLPQHAARLAAPNLSTSETMLKLARQYVFAIIQGRTVEDCFEEEQTKLANEGNSKVTGYISASAYQQRISRQSTITRIKENTCKDYTIKQDQPRFCSKNILQDKMVNIDSSSNSSGLSVLDKSGLYKSHSMPSFEEAAKMRARRQISFDNVDFPKR